MLIGLCPFLFLLCFCFRHTYTLTPYTWAMATPVMSDDGSPEPEQPAPTGTFTYRLPLCEISIQGTSRFQTRAATSDRNGDALLKHDRTFWHWNLKPHYPRGPSPWKQESQRKKDKLKHHQTTFFSKYLGINNHFSWRHSGRSMPTPIPRAAQHPAPVRVRSSHASLSLWHWQVPEALVRLQPQVFT